MNPHTKTPDAPELAVHRLGQRLFRLVHVDKRVINHLDEKARLFEKASTMAKN